MSGQAGSFGFGWSGVCVDSSRVSSGCCGPLVGLLEDRLGLRVRVVAAGDPLLGEQLGAVVDPLVVASPLISPVIRLGGSLVALAG